MQVLNLQLIFVGLLGLFGFACAFSFWLTRARSIIQTCSESLLYLISISELHISTLQALPAFLQSSWLIFALRDRLLLAPIFFNFFFEFLLKTFKLFIIRILLPILGASVRVLCIVGPRLLRSRASTSRNHPIVANESKSTRTLLIWPRPVRIERLKLPTVLRQHLLPRHRLFVLRHSLLDSQLY